jgi:hypothetical protein
MPQFSQTDERWGQNPFGSEKLPYRSATRLPIHQTMSDFHAAFLSRSDRTPVRLFLARARMRRLSATPMACAPTPMALGLNNQIAHSWPCEVYCCAQSRTIRAGKTSLLHRDRGVERTTQSGRTVASFA